MDTLQELWDAQRALNTKTFEANPKTCSVSYEEVLAAAQRLRNARGSDDDRHLVGHWVSQYALAMQQECAELRDSTNWKWWRSKADTFDRQNICVELVDILHFFISACQVMGLSPQDVVRMYHGKREVNVKRQDDGYAVKDEHDSRHIK